MQVNDDNVDNNSSDPRLDRIQQLRRRDYEGAIALSNFGATIVSRGAHASALDTFRLAMDTVKELLNTSQSSSSQQVDLAERLDEEIIEQRLQRAERALIKTSSEQTFSQTSSSADESKTGDSFVGSSASSYAPMPIEISLHYLNVQTIETLLRDDEDEDVRFVLEESENSSSSQRFGSVPCVMKLDFFSFQDKEEIGIVSAITLYNMGVSYMIRGEPNPTETNTSSRQSSLNYVALKRRSLKFFELSLTFLEEKLIDVYEDEVQKLQYMFITLLIVANIVNVARQLGDIEIIERYTTKKNILKKSIQRLLDFMSNISGTLFERCTASAA